MKAWQFIGILALFAAITIVLLLAIPGQEALWQGIGSVALGFAHFLICIIVACVVFGFSLTAGIFGNKFIHWIDARAEPQTKTKTWQRIFIFLLLSAPIAAFQILMMILGVVNLSLWLSAIFKALGYKGFYETAPLGWAIYAFLISWIGYGIRADRLGMQQ